MKGRRSLLPRRHCGWSCGMWEEVLHWAVTPSNFTITHHLNTQNISTDNVSVSLLSWLVSYVFGYETVHTGNDCRNNNPRIACFCIKSSFLTSLLIYCTAGLLLLQDWVTNGLLVGFKLMSYCVHIWGRIKGFFSKGRLFPWFMKVWKCV